jgi:hypothetical protein
MMYEAEGHSTKIHARRKRDQNGLTLLLLNQRFAISIAMLITDASQYSSLCTHVSSH